MKSILSFLKTTLIGGLFFVIPLLVFFFIIGKVIVVFRKVVAPIADKFDISIIGGHTLSRIIAVIALILICLIAGLLAKTKLAMRLKNWIEDNVLSVIPGYTLLKGMSESAMGLDSDNLKDVVMVNIEEVWQIGFLMEEMDDKLNAVFIPGAPNPMSGSVVFVKWDRLKKIDIEEINAMKISRTLGLDAKKILEGKIGNTTFEEKK